MEKENNIWEPSNFSAIFIKDIKVVLQELYNQFRAVDNRNEFLEEENKRLKSEAYKDEELAKMKEQYNRMEIEYYRGFPISKDEDKHIQDWIKTLPEGNDAICSRFHYEFYPTSIGTVGIVVDSITEEKFKFREVD